MTSLLQLLSEYSLALGAGVLFLAVQLGVFLYNRRSVEAVGHEMAQLHASALTAADCRFAWVDWVTRHYQSGLHAEGAVGRDEALRELDRWSYSTPGFPLLQRLSSMAPLLGVIITVIGFLMLSLSIVADDSDAMLGKVGPLVLGVGLGAGLSLVNQILLVLAEDRIDRARNLAQLWFDDLVWPAMCAGRHQDARALGAQLTDLAAATTRLSQQASDQHASSSQMVKAVGLATTRLQQVLTECDQTFQALPRDLAPLKDASLAATAALQTIPNVTTQLVQGLAKSVDSLRSTLDGQLTDLAERHETGGKDLAMAAQRIAAVSTTLDSMTTALDHTLARQSQLADALADNGLPQQELFQAALERIDSATASVAKNMSGIDGSLGQCLTTLAAALPKTQTSLASFDQAVGEFCSVVTAQLVPAAQSQQQVVSAIAGMVTETNRAVHELETACTQLASGTDLYAGSVQEFARSVRQDAVPAHELLRRSMQTIDGTAEGLAEHSDRLRGALDQAATNLAKLLPLGTQLVQGSTETMNELRGVVQLHMAPTAGQHVELVQAVAASNAQLQEVIKTLLNGAGNFSQIAGEQTKGSEALVDATAKIQELSTQLALAASSFRSLAAGETLQAHRTLQETLESLRGSTTQLAQFIHEGLEPATTSLRGLDQVLGSIQSTLDPLKHLAALGKDSAQFLDGLANLHQLIDAVRVLPEQLVTALQKQAVAADASRNGRRNIWDRLFGSR